jgi:outer membrane protein
MRKCFLLITLFGAFIVKAQTYTLKDCIETAIKNNIDVRQAQLQAETAKVYVQQSRANQMPFLNSGISHGISQGRSIDPFTNSYIDQAISYANYSINTNVVLWNGGNLRNTTKRDALSYEANKLDLQQAKDNLTINVILAYLQVLSNQEQLILARQQVDVTRQQVDRLGVLNRQGAIAPATLYDLKGQLATDELNEINVRNTLETARITLTRLMNIDYSAAMQLQKISTDTSLVAYQEQPDVIYQLSTQQLALIRAAEYRQKSAASEIAAAKGSRMPTLLFNGGLGTNYSSAASTLSLINTTDVVTSDYVIVGGNKTYLYTPRNSYESQKISYFNQWRNNLNSSVSLGLRIPILNGAQARSRIKLAEINEQRATAELQTGKTQLKQDIQQAHLNMTSAYERYIKLQQQVSDFTESFNAAEVRFGAGVGTSVDYIIAKNNLERTRVNLVSARYDYELRVKVLDYYQGKPLY